MAIKMTVINLIISAMLINPCNYTRTMEVVKWGNEVLMVDETGNLWDTEDELTKGEKVIVILNDKGTANIKDDVVVRVFK